MLLLGYDGEAILPSKGDLGIFEPACGFLPLSIGI
jgi:hypothetical protein